MKLFDYNVYEKNVEYVPFQYFKGNGYYYSLENEEGLGFGFTEWFQELSGRYILDQYYDTNIIFQWENIIY